MVAFVVSWSLGSPAAAATIRLDATAQTSHTTGSQLTLSNLTVGNGPERLLLVGVATPNENSNADSVTWGGAPLVRIGGKLVLNGDRSGGCTVELWRLLAPAPGNHPVEVTLPRSAPCVVGAASFTGIDQATPHGAQQTAPATSGGPITMDVGGNGSPIFGSMCLGSSLLASWSSAANAPNATAAQGTASVWDVADQTVMALGAYQTNMGTVLRWNVTPNTGFIWTGTGVVLNASATVDLPDASPPPPDTAPPVTPDAAVPPPVDARPPLSDAAPPSIDTSMGSIDTSMASTDALIGNEDLRMGTILPDASDAPPSPPEAEADAAVLPREAGVVVRDLQLQVGCACGTGSRAPALPVGTTILLGLGALLLRLMRARTAAKKRSL
jgi:hypothetical protein